MWFHISQDVQMFITWPFDVLIFDKGQEGWVFLKMHPFFKVFVFQFTNITVLCIKLKH